jgi:hypothetical protein
VKKGAAIIFLLLMVLTQTPAQQLLKLPVLLEHFREHKKEDPHVSFAAFIKLHYFSGNPRDADYDRDQQLPFRECDVLLTGTAIDLPQPSIALDPLQYVVHPSWPLFDVNFYSSMHRFDVWQPPKSR